MNPYLRFKKELKRFGLEWFNLYYGLYAGEVYSVDDPEVVGRLQLKCPAVWGNDYHDYWALPRGMFAGKDVGLFALPNVGDKIWVTFQNGDTRFPVWEYGWWPKSQTPKNASPKHQIWQSTSGHRLSMDDENKILTIKDAEGNTNVMSKDGIILKTAGGHKAEYNDTKGIIRLTTKQGTVFEMGASHVAVGSGTKAKEFSAMGETNLQLWGKFIAHQNVVLVTLVSGFGTQAGVASAVGLLAPLAPGWSTMASALGVEIGNLSGNISAVLPDLISTKVSND